MQNNSKIKKGFLWVKNFCSGWMLMIPSLLLLTLCLWRPAVIGFIYSFFKLKGFEPLEFAGLDNYIKVLADPNYVTAFLNSLKYVLWSLVIGLPLPLLAAFLLNEIIHCKTFFKVSLYVPVTLPSIAVFMIWKLLYLPGENGVLNILISYVGMEPSQWLQNSSITILLIILVMTWQGFGSTTLYYFAALQGINQELYEAAKIDGASIWSRIRYILLPEVYPVVLLFGVRQVIGVFQTFESVMTMTGGGPDNASISLGLLTYKYAFEYFQLDKGLAGSFMTFLMLMVMTIVYFKLEKKLS